MRYKETTWPGWAVLAGVGAIAGLVAFSLLRYPGNLDDPGAPVFLVGLGALVAVYLGLGVVAARWARPGPAFGALFGVAAATCWAVEIWAGGPARLSHSGEAAVGGTFALLAVVVTVAAGVWSGRRGRDPATAMRAGLFAGLASGVLVFCFAVLMTLTNLGVLGARPEYQQQFATGRSHAPDMATFLVGDILAAGIAHLLINLVLGLAGGGLGALVATTLARRPDGAVAA
jgi:hypothetical protein